LPAASRLRSTVYAHVFKKNLDASALKKIIDDLIKRNLAKFLAAAGSTPTEMGAIKFSEPVDFGESEAEGSVLGIPLGINELGVSFGHAAVDGELVVTASKSSSNTLRVTTVSYSGSIDDLYDFDFFGGEKAREAATVEAGHATLAKPPEANSGKVFYLRLEYKGTVNLNKDFNTP